MTNASKYGYKKTLPYSCGVVVGVSAVISVCACFSALMYDLVPTIEPVMRFVGAAYILWLAWSVWSDKPKSSKRSFTDTTSFQAGVFLQFVNVKCFLYALTTMSSFVLPYHRELLPIAGCILVMVALCFVCCNCWALFGSAFERIFKSHSKVLNAVMALLLVYCAATMLIDIWR